jgi:hypothetical protein
MRSRRRVPGPVLRRVVRQASSRERRLAWRRGLPAVQRREWMRRRRSRHDRTSDPGVGSAWRRPRPGCRWSRGGQREVRGLWAPERRPGGLFPLCRGHLAHPCSFTPRPVAAPSKYLVGDPHFEDDARIVAHRHPPPLNAGPGTPVAVACRVGCSAASSLISGGTAQALPLAAGRDPGPHRSPRTSQVGCLGPSCPPCAQCSVGLATVPRPAQPRCFT